LNPVSHIIRNCGGVVMRCTLHPIRWRKTMVLYVCQCGWEFTLLTRLRKHIREKHPDEILNASYRVTAYIDLPPGGGGAKV